MTLTTRTAGRSPGPPCPATIVARPCHSARSVTKLKLVVFSVCGHPERKALCRTRQQKSQRSTFTRESACARSAATGRRGLGSSCGARRMKRREAFRGIPRIPAAQDDRSALPAAPKQRLPPHAPEEPEGVARAPRAARSRPPGGPVQLSGRRIGEFVELERLAAAGQGAADRGETT